MPKSLLLLVLPNSKNFYMWKYYAILSALFAALTAIFAKIGVRDINSNLATAIRTTIILLLTWGIVIATGTTSQIRGIGRST